MKNYPDLHDLEADLTEMGQGMTYPATTDPAPAVAAQSGRHPLRPGMAVSKRWGVLVDRRSDRCLRQLQRR